MMQPTYAILQDWNDADDDGGGKDWNHINRNSKNTTSWKSIEIAEREHYAPDWIEKKYKYGFI